MNKGDTRREASVERKEYERRWEKIDWEAANKAITAAAFAGSALCVTTDKDGNITFTQGERA